MECAKTKVRYLEKNATLCLGEPMVCTIYVQQQWCVIQRMGALGFPTPRSSVPLKLYYFTNSIYFPTSMAPPPPPTHTPPLWYFLWFKGQQTVNLNCGIWRGGRFFGCTGGIQTGRISLAFLSQMTLFCVVSFNKLLQGMSCRIFHQKDSLGESFDVLVEHCCWFWLCCHGDIEANIFFYLPGSEDNSVYVYSKQKVQVQHPSQPAGKNLMDVMISQLLW